MRLPGLTVQSQEPSGSCFCFLSASTVAWGMCLNVRVVGVSGCACAVPRCLCVGGCEGRCVMHQGVKVGWSVFECVRVVSLEQLEWGIQCVRAGCGL